MSLRLRLEAMERRTSVLLLLLMLPRLLLAVGLGRRLNPFSWQPTAPAMGPAILESSPPPLEAPAPTSLGE